MSRSVAILSAALAVGLLSTSADAQSVAELKAELAAKEAQVAKLKKRVRELEQSPPSLIQPAPVAAPVGVRAGPPPPVRLPTMTRRNARWNARLFARARSCSRLSPTR